MGSYKKDFEVAMFSPLKIWTSPFYLKRLLELFFFSFSFSFFFLSLSLFFNTFPSLFSMLRLFEDSGIFMIFEEKDSLQKFFSGEMEWNG
jgi:hypothetical protein